MSTAPLFSGPPVLKGDLSSAPGGVACATMPTGPTGITVFYSQAQPLTSQVFVTSYYNNDVTEYHLRSRSSANPAPRPPHCTGTPQINGPGGSGSGYGRRQCVRGERRRKYYYGLWWRTALSNPPDFHPA